MTKKQDRELRNATLDVARAVHRGTEEDQLQARAQLLRLKADRCQREAAELLAAADLLVAK